jgi:D-glycero-D-manno-heptose 1,7-bisphosphate phosphatase
LPQSPRREERPALFLDRDGVVNVEVNYLHRPRDLAMIPGGAGVIAECNRRGVPVLVVTNQAGIGRGLYGADAYASVNQAIAEELARDGARIDGWYCCPHLPGAGCACRKPEPGLLRTAAAEHALDLGRSVMVGDKVSDLGAARAVAARAILVRTGHGREEERRLLAEGRAAMFDACLDSLADARETILALLGSSGPGSGAGSGAARATDGR